MRWVLVAAGLVAAPAVGSAGEDPASMVGVCALRDAQQQRQCEYYRTEFPRQYPRAVRGDYQARRNVAFMISGAIRPREVNPIRVDVTIACAWRMVIVASGHRQLDRTDHDNLEIDCRRDGVDVARATAEAALILMAGAMAREEEGERLRGGARAEGAAPR